MADEVAETLTMLTANLRIANADDLMAGVYAALVLFLASRALR